MASELRQKTVSGIVWSALQKFGTLGITFVSNIILARLLTPDDYGCVGLLLIFLVISEAFINGGFEAALIQKKECSDEDYSTVFYWNIAVSVLCYITLYFSAPAISDFYNIQKLTPLLRVQSVMILLNALGGIHHTILRKRLNFKKISIIHFIATGVSVAVAIGLAFNGWGVWTLVVQQLVNSFVSTLLLWLTSDWIPKLYISLNSFKELFNYGIFLMLSDLLNNLTANIQALIIGRRYTPADMGYYTQARKLSTIPTQSISFVVSQVTFPVLSQLQQSKEQLFTAVRKTLTCMNFVNFPLMFLLMLIAEPLVIFLFSDKWIESIPYFRILCLAGLFNCLQSVNYQVVCAVGRSRKIFRWNVVKMIAGISFILIGMHWGIDGILYAMVAGSAFTYIVNALVATSTAGYTLFQQLRDSFPLLLISFISAGLSLPIAWIEGLHYVIAMSLQVMVFTGSYILLSHLSHRQELSEYKTILLKK